MTIRTAIAGTFASLTFAALVIGWIRIRGLEDGERELSSDWISLDAASGAPGSTVVSARLMNVAFHFGESALVEVCAQDKFHTPGWSSGVELVVWEPGRELLVVRTPLTRDLLASIRPGDHMACLVVGDGLVPASGIYALDAVWPERPPPPSVRSVLLRGRALARSALGPLDLAPLGISWLCTLAVVWTLGLKARPRPDASPARWVKMIVGVGLLWSVQALLSLVMFTGASGAMTRGLIFHVSAAVIAVALIGGQRAESLGLVAPRQPAVGLLIAIPAMGIVLAALAKLAVHWVPSTGEAPVQAFVSWPSGLMSFALLATVAPVSEELFFRGFIYGSLERVHPSVAFAAASLLFVAAHAPQVWGNWGGLVGVAGVGIFLTALRAWTGSTTTSMIVHLVYNGTLAASAVL